MNLLNHLSKVAWILLEIYLKVAPNFLYYNYNAL